MLEWDFGKSQLRSRPGANCLEKMEKGLHFEYKRGKKDAKIHTSKQIKVNIR